MSWRTVRLGDCVRLASGGTPSKSNAGLWSGDIPWASCKDMKSLRLHDTEDHVSHQAIGNGTRLVTAGTILIVVRGMILAKDFPVAEAQRPLTFNQDLKAVTVLPGVESRFLLYWFLARRQLLMSACDEAAHGTKRLQTDRLLGMPVCLPRLATQRRIAEILSSYDDLIENNTRRIAILEEMARRIYEEWFVRFRFPGHKGIQMVESELGPMPQRWQIGTVADVAVVYRGRSYKGSELADSGGRPFVNLKCMERDGGFRASGLKRYTGQFKESHTVRPGDLVMGITDMTQERRIVARVGRVSGLDTDFGVFSMDLVRIASRGVYAEQYLYAMFRWSSFADEVKQHANGANVLHLLPARIEEFAFARPTPELAAQFADLLTPMLSLCDTLERKNANLRATRDLLLPKLISGELDVSAMPEPEALAA
ncbi:MAG: restriction endonuclease subunit S [Rubrivivax sp.]